MLVCVEKYVVCDVASLVSSLLVDAHVATRAGTLAANFFCASCSHSGGLY